jgi:hypothetical protein
MADKPTSVILKVEFNDPGPQLPWRSSTQRHQTLKPDPKHKLEVIALTPQGVAVTNGHERVEVPWSQVRQIIYGPPPSDKRT